MREFNLAIERWKTITGSINALEKALKRPVTLVAVSKTQPQEAILPLLEAGHRVFGENRIQEAMEKWPLLRERYPDIELHLIGSLQTNKVKEALSLFDVIHTIDRAGLVDAIYKEKNKAITRCNQFLIQINTGKEPQKGGALIENLPSLIAYMSTRIPVNGLMCIPPAEDIPDSHFALLSKLAKKYKLPYLSMGMSNDYKTAIKFGATHVRIGTALFGERKN